MEHLNQFYRRVEQIYMDPSLNKNGKFINMMKVFYNLHEFYMKHYSQIIGSFRDIFEESEHLRTMIHNTHIALMRCEKEYEELVLQNGYIEDNEKIKNLVVEKISKTIEFIERKIADEFRV